MTIQERHSQPATGSRLLPRLFRWWVGWELGSIVIAVCAFTVVLGAAFPRFLSAFNVASLLSIVAVMAVVGLAQMAVLSIGHFNLAVPAIGAMAAMTLGWAIEVMGMPPLVALTGSLAIGAFLGLVQGWCIVGPRLNPFVVTLGLAGIYAGLMIAIFGNSQFQKLGPDFRRIGNEAAGPVPILFIITVGIGAIVWVFFQRSVTGREILATGMSPVAAYFSAIPTDRRVMTAHTLSGLLTACAAGLLVGRLGSAQPAIGQDWLLSSFAAPVLGGCALGGGRVTVVGTILGALLLAMISNALVIIGVSQYWYQAGLGLLILAAVSLEVIRLRLLARGQG